MKPLIIGQAPGYAGAGEPLSGRAGRRLSALCGLTLDEYLLRFDRMNVFEVFPGKAGKGDRFPRQLGRMRAERLLPTCSGRRVVLLGAAVADAFQFHGGPLQWAQSLTPVYATWAWCPHPSGINMWWNVQANVEAARLF